MPLFVMSMSRSDESLCAISRDHKETSQRDARRLKLITSYRWFHKLEMQICMGFDW